MTTLAQVGDVLIADSGWAYGHRDTSGKFTIGWKYGDGVVVDNRRVGKRYVVTDTRMTGGGVAMSADRFADGHYVTVQRLKEDGTYDPKGEVVSFYQTGDFMCKIPVVRIVGKMQRSVTFL